MFRKTEHIDRYVSAEFSSDDKLQNILNQINRHEMDVKKDQYLL